MMGGSRSRLETFSDLHCGKKRNHISRGAEGKMQEPEEVVKYTFYLVSVLWVSLSFNSCAFSQTLAQTAAYLLSGGFADLGDIREVDPETVRVPGYMPTPMFYVYPVTLKVTNRDQCEVLSAPDGNETSLKEINVYFNNVIVDEIDVRTQLSGFSNFWLKGEEYVVCLLLTREGKRTCLREFDTSVRTENLERVGKAVTYLYSNFCTSARRKRAV